MNTPVKTQNGSERLSWTEPKRWQHEWINDESPHLAGSLDNHAQDATSDSWTFELDAHAAPFDSSSVADEGWEVKADAPTKPLNYRPAAKRLNAPHCGSCKMYNKGRCWGYGNIQVKERAVCDSYTPSSHKSAIQDWNAPQEGTTYDPEHPLGEIAARHPNVDMFATERPEGLRLKMIQVAPEQQRQGYAGAALNDLLGYADERGLPVALNPGDVEGRPGMSNSQLRRWYAEHGFLPNKGRNKDYTFTEAMLRPADNSQQPQVDGAQQGNFELDRPLSSFAGDLVWKLPVFDNQGDMSGWHFAAEPDELFIALNVPKPTADEIHEWAKKQDWPEGTELEEPSEYHITLLYAPKGHKEHREAEWWATDNSDSIHINGIEEFPSTERGELNAFVLRVDTSDDEIKTRMDRLLDDAESHGVEVKRYPGGSKPHITVAYGPKLPDGLEPPDMSFSSDEAHCGKPRTSSVDDSPHESSDDERANDGYAYGFESSIGPQSNTNEGSQSASRSNKNTTSDSSLEAWGITTFGFSGNGGHELEDQLSEQVWSYHDGDASASPQHNEYKASDDASDGGWFLSHLDNPSERSNEASEEHDTAKGGESALSWPAFVTSNEDIPNSSAYEDKQAKRLDAKANYGESGHSSSKIADFNVGVPAVPTNQEMGRGSQPQTSGGPSLSEVAHNLHYKFDQSGLDPTSARQYANRLLQAHGYSNPDEPTIEAAIQAWKALYPSDLQSLESLPGMAPHSFSQHSHNSNEKADHGNENWQKKPDEYFASGERQDSAANAHDDWNARQHDANANDFGYVHLAKLADDGWGVKVAKWICPECSHSDNDECLCKRCGWDMHGHETIPNEAPASYTAIGRHKRARSSQAQLGMDAHDAIVGGELVVGGEPGLNVKASIAAKEQLDFGVGGLDVENGLFDDASEVSIYHGASVADSASERGDDIASDAEHDANQRNMKDSAVANAGQTLAWEDFKPNRIERQSNDHEGSGKDKKDSHDATIAHQSKKPKVRRTEKPQKCKECKSPATKSLIWAEGMAYVPVCEKHEQKVRKELGEDEVCAVHTIKASGAAQKSPTQSSTHTSMDTEWKCSECGRTEFSPNREREHVHDKDYCDPKTYADCRACGGKMRYLDDVESSVRYPREAKLLSNPSSQRSPQGYARIRVNEVTPSEELHSFISHIHQGDSWDTRQWPDPIEGTRPTDPLPKGCTCQNGQDSHTKLTCPVHGLEANGEYDDQSWTIPENSPVGYPQDQPRNWTQAVSHVVHTFTPMGVTSFTGLRTHSPIDTHGNSRPSFREFPVDERLRQSIEKSESDFEYMEPHVAGPIPDGTQESVKAVLITPPNAYRMPDHEWTFSKIAVNLHEVGEPTETGTDFHGTRRPFLYFPDTQDLILGAPGADHATMLYADPRIFKKYRYKKHEDDTSAGGVYNDPQGNKVVEYYYGAPDPAHIQAVQNALGASRSQLNGWHTGDEVHENPDKVWNFNGSHKIASEYDAELEGKVKTPENFQGYPGAQYDDSIGGWGKGFNDSNGREHEWHIGEDWAPEHMDMEGGKSGIYDPYQYWIIEPDGKRRVTFDPKEGEDEDWDFNSKVSMPVSDEFWQGYPGPLYHGTTEDRLPSIMQHGLQPWDSPIAGGSRYEDGNVPWLMPRPNHVYLSQSPEEAHKRAREASDPEHRVVVLRVDPSHLRPENIDPDEDDAFRYIPGAPSAFGDSREIQKQLGNKSLGEWAEENEWGEPHQTEQAIGDERAIAHRGPIPPSAITPGTYDVDMNEPPPRAYEWRPMVWPQTTSRVAANHMLNWQPGQYGKGLVHEGVVHTWPTNDDPDGQPGHPQYAQENLGFNTGEHFWNHPTWETAFTIDPEGRTVLFEDRPDIAETVQQADPRLKVNSLHDWDFGPTEPTRTEPDSEDEKRLHNVEISNDWEAPTIDA